MLPEHPTQVFGLRSIGNFSHLMTFNQGNDMMWTPDERKPNCEKSNDKHKRGKWFKDIFESSGLQIIRQKKNFFNSTFKFLFNGYSS